MEQVDPAVRDDIEHHEEHARVQARKDQQKKKLQQENANTTKELKQIR
jgi:hypothetical protein